MECGSGELEELRRSVRRLAEDKILPLASEIDASGEFPWGVKEELARSGLMAIPFPSQYGGVDADNDSAMCVAVEEIARVCASSSLVIQVQHLAAQPILLAGTESQKNRYCPNLANGQWLGAFALTEPGAGSDVGAISTLAKPGPEGYEISGRKCFISNGSVADVVIVFAKTDPQAGARGLSAFIVEKSFPGFGVGRIEKKMGVRGSPAAEIVLEGCRVPRANLLGEEGGGFALAMRTLDRTRPVIAAQAVGIAQGALDVARRYACERRQFGRAITEFQGIQFMLAEMAAELEAARALTYYAARLADEGSPRLSYFAAAAKLIASDTAMRVTTDAVQIAGGYGYMTDLPLERMMRDAKITQIYEGTNQILRLVIARELLQEGRPS